ncbi:MAG: hypothetical protein V1930_09635 [Pseudomonadota bacterium]
MARKIKLQTCFALARSDSERMVLPEVVKTVSDLLSYMGGKIDFSFTDPGSGRIEDDLEIILNNKDIWFYPEALNRELQDGDIVEIYLLPLGGG